MAHTFFNFCDYCHCLTDILYVDDETGLELCEECFNYIDDNDDDDWAVD